jgi:hypothetical protein
LLVEVAVVEIFQMEMPQAVVEQVDMVLVRLSLRLDQFTLFL